MPRPADAQATPSVAALLRPTKLPPRVRPQAEAMDAPAAVPETTLAAAVPGARTTEGSAPEIPEMAQPVPAVQATETISSVRVAAAISTTDRDRAVRAATVLQRLTVRRRHRQPEIIVREIVPEVHSGLLSLIDPEEAVRDITARPLLPLHTVMISAIAIMCRFS